jgi:putative flippase GtrA
MLITYLLDSKVIRYIIAGVLSAGLEMGLLITLVEHLGHEVLTANVIAFIITNIANYIMSRYWVFNQQTIKKRIEFPVFMFFVTCGLLINQVVLWYLVNQISIDYRIAKVVSIGTVVVWNFFTRNSIIFKKERPDRASS